MTPLQARLAAVAQKLRADFSATAQTQHHVSRGTEREEVVAKYLRPYLPQSVEILHNAEIITAAGETSPQCDLVIVDRNTPRLTDLESHHIVPAECVIGVIEVKSKLTAQGLKEDCAKIQKVKKLERVAYVKAPRTPLHAVPLLYPPVPIFGYVFAFDGDSTLKTQAKRLHDWCVATPLDQHPDGIWIADMGMVVWAPAHGNSVGPDLSIWHASISYPELGRKLMALRSADEGSLLLGLVIAICTLLVRPRPPFDLTGYLDNGLTYKIESTISFP